MPLTTAQAFDRFQEIISPTVPQRSDITAKRESTEKYLRAAFPPSSTMPLKRVILIGSASRGTIVRPVNDIDVMAEFTNKDNIFNQYRTDSGAFLQRIRAALNAKTTIGKIGARGKPFGCSTRTVSRRHCCRIPLEHRWIRPASG